MRSNIVNADSATPEQRERDDSMEAMKFLPQIVFRGGWGALPPKETSPLTHPITHLIYTYTGTDECSTPETCMRTVQELQKLHMGFGKLPDIKYNFLIGGDFNIYEGRGWRHKATKDPATSDLDGKTIDIAFIGDYKTKEPPNRMYLTNNTLLNSGLSQGFITKTINVTPTNDAGEIVQNTVSIQAEHPAKQP